MPAAAAAVPNVLPSICLSLNRRTCASVTTPSSLTDSLEHRNSAVSGPANLIVVAPALLIVVDQSETGGEPQPAVRASDFGGAKLRWPHLLPDASVLLFTVWSGSVEHGSARCPCIPERQVADTHRGHQPPGDAETGHLLSARDGSLWAGRFDWDRLIVKGFPVPVLEHLLVNTGGLALLVVASDGSPSVSERIRAVPRLPSG